jgi:tRNA G18 (ribose-2'-O)-methylase SpoU
MLTLDSIDDARLSAYRNLKDRELARLGGRFIAESDLIVRRLLASGYQTESVLVASRKAEAIAAVVPPQVPLYVLPEAMLDAVIGYAFHTGVLAVGLRQPSPKLQAILPAPEIKSTLVILPEITNAENMGSLIRISSAFGADAIVLGPRCCDPFYRMSIRVSMGTIFSIPMLRSADMPADLANLRNDHGYDLVATVLDSEAEILDRSVRHPRQGILFGNEATGLNPPEIAACNRRVTLPMSRGTDSLNVAVAAGVFLYHFTRESTTRESTTGEPTAGE